MAALLAKYGQVPGTIALPLNFLAVRHPRGLVAIDAGYGDFSIRRDVPAGYYLERFRALGLRPEDVGTVILTHSHPDHFGGIGTSGGQLLFPNARFVMSAAEARHLQSAEDWLQQRYRLTAGRLDLVNEPTDVLPGIRVLPAPGHTPGHLMVELLSQGESLLHTSDLLLHAIHVQHPEWSVAYEFDRPAAAAFRRATLETAAATGQLLFSTHLPFPGLGHVVQGKWVHKQP